MGGTSDEANGSEEVEILAVCLNSHRGGGTKMAVFREPLIQLTPNLDTVYLRVCPTTRWCCFHSNYVTGCIRVHEMHLGCFSGLKSTKNKERYSLEWVDVLPECYPKCPEVFPGVCWPCDLSSECPSL